MVKLLNVIIVDYGFISNAIKLTLKLTYTSRKKVVPGIVFLAEAKIFPFSNLNEDDFHKTIHGKKVKFLTIAKKKRNQNEQILIEKVNNAIDREDLRNSSSWFHVNKLNNNFYENEFNGTNFLHINISSICRNFDELQTLLAKINVKFNVIGITGTRLNKTSIRNINIDLNGYSFEHIPTEAN